MSPLPEVLLQQQLRAAEERLAAWSGPAMPFGPEDSDWERVLIYDRLAPYWFRETPVEGIPVRRAGESGLSYRVRLDLALGLTLLVEAGIDVPRPVPRSLYPWVLALDEILQQAENDAVHEAVGGSHGVDLDPVARSMEPALLQAAVYRPRPVLGEDLRAFTCRLYEELQPSLSAGDAITGAIQASLARLAYVFADAS